MMCDRAPRIRAERTARYSASVDTTAPLHIPGGALIRSPDPWRSCYTPTRGAAVRMLAPWSMKN